MPKEHGKRRGVGSVIGYLVGLAVLIGAGYLVFHISSSQDAQLVASREALAEGIARGPRVQVTTITTGPHERLITLLGDTRANQTVTLYSKVAGYLKSIAVDRGDRVTAGQIIAEVRSAETDHQYDSALTDLENKRRNMLRARDLVAHGSMSIQAADQADTDFRMATETAAQFSIMKSYEVLHAPFDGVVTARFVDVGALVQNSTTNQVSNQPVVTIVDDSRLRVDVHVEQRDVPYIHVGDSVDVADAADESRKIVAHVSRTSAQLDPRTRTLLVEVDLDNSGHFLVPGSFAYVTLHIPLPSYPEIPMTALVVRGTNTFVADVSEQGIVHLRPVKVASTDGVHASLSDGVRVGDKVALDLPDEISDGGKVQAVASR
jgi:RND family efflux transporter MFP subunit